MKRLGGVGSIARALMIVPLLVAGLALTSVRPASAATNCVGSVNGGTIKGDIIVPADGDCELYNVTVTGSVTVKQGADFEADYSVIRGGISASKAYYVEIHYSEVRGNVSSSGAEYIYFYGSDFRGNTAISGSQGGYVDIEYNTFRTSVVLSKNDFGSEYFYGNDVAVNLVCNENINAGIYYNDVKGNVVGDCPFAESDSD